MGTSADIDAEADSAYVTKGVLGGNAAGKDGSTNVGYPASHENVMAIGASNQSDQKASFSQHGPDLEVSAPGTSIFTLTRTVDGTYASTSGTSFSAPLTSGIASLIFSHNSQLTNAEVREILQNSADKVGGYDYDYDVNFPGRSFEMGYGRVNAFEALLLAETYGQLPDSLFKNGFENPDIIFINGFD